MFDILKLSKSLDSLGYTKQSKILQSIVKYASDFPEEKFEAGHIIRESGESLHDLQEEMNLEDEILNLLNNDAEKDKGKSFLKGIETTLKDREFEKEYSLKIASNMAQRGFLLSVTRGGGKRAEAKDLMAELFGIWGGSDAKEYFLSHMKELEDSFNQEGRSFLTKKESQLINDLSRFSWRLKRAGLKKEADMLEEIIVISPMDNEAEADSLYGGILDGLMDALREASGGKEEDKASKAKTHS
jgi:hypothetical protein